MKKALLILVAVAILAPFSGTLAAKSKAIARAKKTAPVASKQKCNPNYSGCLKVGTVDYDCKGGSGNGPYYTGKVKVIGYDQYDLDRDRDGWACE